MTRHRALLAALLSGCASACSPDIPSVTHGCSSSADCKLDEVCDRLTNSCTGVAPETLVGSLDCLPAETSGPGGVSDALGSFEGQRMPFSADAACHAYLGASVPYVNLELTGYLRGAQVYGELYVPIADLSVGSTATLGPGKRWTSFSSGHLYDDSAYLASTPGSVVPLAPFQIGYPFTVYFELDLLGARENTAPLGTPCNGVADCGSTDFSICDSFAVGVTRTFCFGACDTAVNQDACTALGGVCDAGSGFCALPCGSGCPAPLQCGNFNGASYCY